MQQVNEHAPKDVVKMLVGNKVDLDDERVVQQREGQALANKYHMPFMEISARTGFNVNNLFLKMGELLISEYLPQRKQDKLRYSLSLSSQLIGQK